MGSKWEPIIESITSSLLKYKYLKKLSPIALEANMKILIIKNWYPTTVLMLYDRSEQKYFNYYFKIQIIKTFFFYKKVFQIQNINYLRLKQLGFRINSLKHQLDFQFVFFAEDYFKILFKEKKEFFFRNKRSVDSFTSRYLNKLYPSNHKNV